jgi:O-acetyl-ADP-ribose deacetylase (regulator of RNase III)
MLKYIDGDLIELAKKGNFQAIVHGCNCFNTMGSGIAKQVKETWPGAFKADLATLPGDVFKLGDFTSFIDKQGRLIIYNAYTQYGYMPRGVRHTEYCAILYALNKIGNDLPSNSRIGIPLIGCGLGGGEWRIVEPIVDKTLGKCHDVTVVRFTG